MYNLKEVKSEIVTLHMDIYFTLSLGDFVRLLKAIAKEGSVKEVLTRDFICKYRLRAVNSVSPSFKKLINNELVYQTDEGYIYMIALWVNGCEISCADK